MNPRVSVIVPIFNVEPYIEECLQSLVGQTFGDFEAICVDNGSTDASLAVARNAVAGDERFTFIEVKEQGLSYARNAALDIVRGDYLLNLDSDDFYRPDTLERLVKKADDEQLDLLFFSAKTFYESSDLARTNPERQDNRADVAGVLSGADMFVEFERTGAFRPSACMYMMRRELVEASGMRFEEGIIHEDLPFTTMLVPLAKRTAFLNDTFYQRRMRYGSTMTARRGVNNIKGHLVGSMRMEEWITQHGCEYSAAFVDAFCGRIHRTWELIAEDVAAIGIDEALAFRETLTIQQRIAFDLHGIELQRSRAEILDSTTYKVGHALLAVPTALKDRLSRES